MLTELLTLLAGVAAGGAAMAVVARRREQTRVRETARGARTRAFLQGRDARLPSYTPSSARDSDEQLITQYLRIVRETCGADLVTLWRAQGEQAVRAGSSSGQVIEVLPARLDALVRWAQSEPGIVHFDADLPPRHAAVATRDERGQGATRSVLALHADRGLTVDVAAVRSIAARHADHLSELLTLLETRHEVHRQHSAASTLLRAAEAFQSNRSLERLTESICSATLELTAADRSALIRWHGASYEGVVEGVSAGHWASRGLPVEQGSLVAQACADAMPLLWRDARELSREAVLLAANERRAPAGTLAIVPLERDLGVVGALVVEGELPGDISADDVRSLRLLAAIAAVSLEAQWEFDEVAARARTDQLTGLPNRRYFDEQFARMLAEADRFEHSLALLLLDIDHFKRVNDRHGHDTGDEVLKAVARVLKAGVRGVDVCARFGGEEMAVLLPNTELRGASELAERLRAAIAAAVVQAGGQALSVTASFGIAAYPAPVADASALFGAADKALYAAKGAGRDCVRVAS